MHVDQLPAAVQRLIREQVRTYDALEIVLLLYRDRGRAWRLADLAAAVRLPEDAARAVVADLTREQLLVETHAEAGPAVRLQDERPEVASAVAELATAWDEHRLALIKLLNASALERLRTGAARALSDAFLFNRRKHDG